MAETKCFIPNQLLDLDQIQEEAKHRWLRPTEICEILSNYKKFDVRSSPPCMPPAGSLFLFDRKTLRYFRKDGHRWRKKKDGKIVKEAHEKLKAGSVDVLHCYYAHGEDNENFQRRSYWMLDKQFENIVLVHYREVKEGYKSGSMLQSSQSGLSPSFEQTVQTSYASDPNSVDWNEHSVSSRLNDAHSSHDLGTSSLTNGDTTGYLERDPFGSGFPGVSFDPDGHDHFQDFSIPDSCIAVQVHANSENLDVKDDETGGLKKLDSFGRWMDKEMGGDCEDSLMASDSGNYWNAIDTENDKNEVSSLSHHMQLNTDSVGPSLAKEQLFSICDFAPDWAYSGTETKVLITGTFLGDKKYSSAIKWCCMFGEIEVPAERVTETAIRCQVPSHAAGRVPFYVTCSNRLACSEVREFEYLEKPSRLADNHNISDEDEFGLLLRFSKSISLKLQRKWLGCAVANCEKCKLKDAICSLESNKERSWRRIMEVFKGNSKKLLIENLLKDKLYEWLICEAHEACRGLRALDEKGQGVVHLAAALGYEWAVVPIVAIGLGPNFRDARGRTALHWAALYGREETVVALIKQGALPGAVDDPTPSNPGGQTAADLASSRGHKGIAGYLAEADLTSHLSALSINDNVATVSVPDVFATNEEHSLRGSLAAVRKSAHAAALIQDAFRARSFRQRQVTQNVNNSHEANDLFALTSLHKVHKTSHYEDYLHVAASRIQQNYLGWKGRNDFLKIRERIVKIQAHFRGHQVRKHYKKVVWSVGIVEKAILRWRRKSRGLRGFRPEFTRGDSAGEGEKCDEYDYLHISRRQKYIGVEKALARVHSMARHLEGRDQYMRLLKSEKLSHEESSGRSDEG